MNILLIRSRERSVRTAARLAELGHVVVFLPVTRTNIMPFEIPAQPFDGIIFTSAVAPDIVASAIKNRSINGISLALPVWCVGDATANAAREAGFGDIRTGPGNAEQLAAIIAEHHGRSPARLFYPSAKDIAFDMAAALGHQSVLRQIVYEVELVDLEPEQISDALNRVSNGALLLYSARTAAQFFGLVERHGLARTLDSTAIIAISDKVANTVETTIGMKPKVAATPDEEAMLALL